MEEHRLLAVLAHPDDESFGMGGTLALYSDKGADVYLVCATRGEAGDVDDILLKEQETIAALRERELCCAADILGLKGVYFLDYRDSGMPGSIHNQHPNAQINFSIVEVAGRVVSYIRKLKPDVVLTFDPIGGYKHPDHIHIQRATTLAFEKAGDPDFFPEAGSPYTPGALYYHTFPRNFIRLAVFLSRIFGKDPSKFGRNRDIDLASIASQKYPTHVRINIRPALSKKDRASECHSSQGGSQMRQGVMGWFRILFGSHETYMRAFPPVNKSEKVLSDFFDSK